MKFFSLFSGIGGFDLPLIETGHICVGYSEIDKYAISVYKYHFGEEVKNYGDATNIDAGRLPDFDILCGGFPCQSFSIAGKRKGFEDTRGTLFFDIARILEAKRPKLILLENVKGLLNHSKGKTFTIIIQTLEELGYHVEWMVLNSKFFGVPQNRERVFIIGHLTETSRRQILPFRQNATKIPRVPKEEEEQINCGTITQAFGRYGCSKEELRMYEATYKAHRANEIREHEGSPTLTQNMGTGGNNVPMVMNLQARNPNRPSMTKQCSCGSGKLYCECCGVKGGSGTFGKENEAYTVDTNCTQGVALRAYPRQKSGEKNRIQNIEVRNDTVSNTISTVQKDSLLIEYDKLRRLTPIECERLQGFPDNWTKYGWSDKDDMVIISDSQRYRQLGNAVTTNVVRAIIKRLT